MDAEITMSLVTSIRRKLCNSTAEQIKSTMNIELITKLNPLLYSTDTQMALESIWILSNLAAISNTYITIIKELGIDHKALEIFIKGSMQVKEEVYSILNIGFMVIR